jgi:hypothetical protein
MVVVMNYCLGARRLVQLLRRIVHRRKMEISSHHFWSDEVVVLKNAFWPKKMLVQKWTKY